MSGLRSLAAARKQWENFTTEEVGEIYELLYWMFLIVGEERELDLFLPPTRLYQARVSEAFEIARKLGICQNRLWNLAIASQREQFDIPALMKLAETSPRTAMFLQHGEHKDYSKASSTKGTLSDQNLGSSTDYN